METFAVRCPVAIGVKVTLIVQLAPLARLLPQVLLEMAKSVPTMLTLIEFNVRLPTLVRVMSFGLLVIPTG
jgi:hypothetical protein